MPSIAEVGVAFVTVLMTVLWWLLRQKDERQQKEMDELRNKHNEDVKLLRTEHAAAVHELWAKHDEDVRRLQELELRIASSHYVKTELDGKFERLEDSIRDGLTELGAKFDRFGEVVIQMVSSKR